MYMLMLDLHSWLRWAVIGTSLIVLILAITGLSKGREYETADRKAGLFWMISFDLQLLVGLALYFWWSPFTATARATPGWIKDPTLRFWMLEHAAGMLLAVVAVHIGRVLVKRAATAHGRHLITLFTVILSLLLVLGSMPWPNGKIPRPLFRVQEGS